MKKNMIYIFITLFVMGITGGCSKESETLEEKLIAQEWSVTYSDGSSSTMTFYENHTAIAEAVLIKESYEWSVNEDEMKIVVIWKSYSTTCTMTFDIEDDGAGYVFTLSDFISDPNSAYYNSTYTEMYDTVKLTPSK